MKEVSLQALSFRAIEIRNLYNERNQREIGKPWATEDLMLGFVVDVGDLARTVMAQEGLREMKNADATLRHELADCLWSLLVIADEYRIPLHEIFPEQMDRLEKKILET
ncbi:nucleotide pyrophosphohydrolase [Streptomyces sp. NBC_00252]|uniref:nucleotide pyrophosphohydrolase n=1 Tax=Streptomyces sp. NBC_00252 TaxID=2975691 RepID=UPI002E27EE69|nr:nucleotide pyrophosphohydrolase [Streptomyces sp. NBC_00252]